ncbi:hypothetical protein MAPG_00054 [Magnaporthiopsis poae ATCC 64411]|uniref:Uncharacterized protein n=1 Tax=Magnaporthiopsis poae (strain ATCC 64411 / 73-15) TaxID=644358 RepID=A0A0C4DJZ4_MAGP6|nr:hypothetical protein MAPG_00054 [Magnaporthiopsis poae ATCC 64411]
MIDSNSQLHPDWATVGQPLSPPIQDAALSNKFPTNLLCPTTTIAAPGQKARERFVCSVSQSVVRAVCLSVRRPSSCGRTGVRPSLRGVGDGGGLDLRPLIGGLG